MKKFAKLGAVVAIVLSVIMLAVACSSFGGIKSAFESKGYKYSQETADAFKTVVADLEKEDIVVTPHLFTYTPEKLSDITKTDVVFILEFNNESDLKKTFEENETLKKIVSDVSKSDLVKGNCVMVLYNPVGDALEIFKNA